MIRELKVIFETHAAVESYEASKQFFGCMMEEGSSVSEHVFAMSGHARKLSDLGIVIPNQLGIHRVLQSLPPSYKNFVMNYNMQNMNKELPELFSMLKSAEVEIQKEHQVLMVNKTTNFKKQGKPKKGNLKKGGKKAAAPPEKPKGGPKPDTDCYYCNGKGHWKRNCPKYLADLKSGLVKKKKEKAQKPKCSEKSRKITKILFHRKTQGARRARPRRPRASHNRPARPGVVTPPYGVGPSGLFRLRLFAYKMPRDLNLRQIDETPENIQGAAIAKLQFGGQSPCSAPPDGELPQAISTAIFTAIAVPMMRRE
ncbi:hypothetical protein QYE76_030113 [Lolium multiflorum]|uniref:CCHC-type domain-containing protein n=1 Tax=Lolium multiflorum TaxID=4521 RepID=A0AAD8VIY6_LOLMU|nr:hypothetical protein QYE76_030113 [Lolium multiflorum]